MPLKKILILTVIVCGISSFYIFGLAEYFTLDFFLGQRDSLLGYQAENPVPAALVFFFTYILITAFSLPAATLITLLGGAIFGLAQGLLLVSFASTIGASLAFLMARTLFQDSVQKRFESNLEKINKGIEKEGAFYLFSLRLVPVFPFVAVNLLMGLTKIPLTRYFWVSQLGMLPGTFVYVNAGTQLAEVNSLGQIASPAILLSFAALGLFPLLAKRLVEHLRALKAQKDHNKANND
jgi:uncharacterized membrane protein YdjX (TVP38/TMEM64 family)